MTDYSSNLAEWVSEYPDLAKFFESDVIAAIFAQERPKREEDSEWKKLIANLNLESEK
jgi:hypothetical protein